MLETEDWVRLSPFRKNAYVRELYPAICPKYYTNVFWRAIHATDTHTYTHIYIMNINFVFLYLADQGKSEGLIAATGLVITLKFDSNHRVLAVWPWNLTNDLENNRTPLLCYFKLCVSFRSHWWIQTWVTVRKRPTWVKINDFFSRVTLKFDGWLSKTIGHLFHAISSFVHHFVVIGEFKLELQSGNIHVSK